MVWLVWSAACNDCSYYARCDGNTRLVCGESVDQLYNRQVNRVECDAENPVCVELGDSDATCAISAEVCDPEEPGVCEGDVAKQCTEFYAEDIDGVVYYDTNLVVARDCAEEGRECALDGDASTCSRGG
ncbi:MAG: hypothetical protein ABMA64_18080 [Myxococcota bacterium]